MAFEALFPLCVCLGLRERDGEMICTSQRVRPERFSMYRKAKEKKKKRA